MDVTGPTGWWRELASYLQLLLLRTTRSCFCSSSRNTGTDFSSVPPRFGGVTNFPLILDFYEEYDHLNLEVGALVN